MCPREVCGAPQVPLGPHQSGVDLRSAPERVSDVIPAWRLREGSGLAAPLGGLPAVGVLEGK